MKSASDEGQLSVESSLDLLLVLLYAPGGTGKSGEPIEGITRLQKLVFLLQQGEGPKKLVKLAQAYAYEPYKMGPYTRQLQEEIDILKALGLVRTNRLKYLLTDDEDTYEDLADPPTRRRQVESLQFELTEEGMQAAQELWEGLTESERDGLSEFKSFFNSLSLRQLLIFVYEKFPKFSTESTIKHQLGL